MKGTSIGILVFDCVDEMDVAGPWEVLTSWRYVTAEHSEGQSVCGKEASASSLVTVATFALGESLRPVRCAKGLKIVPDFLWGSKEMPHLDVLLYPGGPDMDPHFNPDDPRFDPGYRTMVESLRASGTLMVSVCVGALAFAHFGLLHCKPATTHWLAVDAMLAADPTIIYEPKRYVDAGDVISSAGISAGIDLAFYLVERLETAARAREVRRYIQYEPAPPASILGNPGDPGWAVGQGVGGPDVQPQTRSGHPAQLFRRGPPSPASE